MEKKEMNAPANDFELMVTEWTKGHEKILIDWADKATCYRWLHARSHQYFSKINTYFTIPVIIMSTLTGTANFAQDRVPESYRGYYSMGVGFVNILAGIITTIQQFLKISELSEGHRVSAIHWDKFYRKIKVELSKPTSERQNITDFLKNCTEEFDRLMETSPIIQKNTIALFKNTFSGTKMTCEQKVSFKNLKKPEICDVLESVQSSLYVPDTTHELKTNYKKLLNDLILNQQLTESNTIENIENKKKDIVKNFIVLFETEMMRQPTLNELYSNLISEELQIDKEYLTQYWNNALGNLNETNIINIGENTTVLTENDTNIQSTPVKTEEEEKSGIEMGSI